MSVNILQSDGTLKRIAGNSSETGGYGFSLSGTTLSLTEDGAKSINLPIPTKISDLTDGSNVVEEVYSSTEPSEQKEGSYWCVQY